MLVSRSIGGNNTSGTPKAMQNYLSNIASRMSQPLRVRVGGDTMEFSNYSSSLTNTMLKHLNVKANYTVATTYGPVLFDVMNKMADDVGDMQFLTGLSMHNPPQDGGDDEALKVASVATDKLGSRLDAFLLGNVSCFVHFSAEYFLTPFPCRSPICIKIMRTVRCITSRIM